MFQNKKLKRNATYAIAEVAEVALLITLCPPLNFTVYARNQLNLSMYSLHYAEACNEFASPILASLRTDDTALFQEMLQR